MSHNTDNNNSYNERDSNMNNEAIEKHLDSSKYDGDGIRVAQHGVYFQLQLLMLILWRSKGYFKFRFSSELPEADKFDDVVLQYQPKENEKWKLRMFQAKHKLDATKTITEADLITGNGKIRDDFCLVKYFNSFCKIKSSSKQDSIFLESEIEDLIICTNMILDSSVENQFSDDLGNEIEQDRLLKVLTTFRNEKTRIVRIKEDSQIMTKLKENSSTDFSQLVGCINKMIKKPVETGLNTLDILFKTYMHPLMENVFELNSNYLKFRKDFIKGHTLTYELKNALKLSDKELESVQILISQKLLTIFESNFKTAIEGVEEFCKQMQKLVESCTSKKIYISENSIRNHLNLTDLSDVEKFKRNVRRLAGHVIVEIAKKLKFSSSFLYRNVPRQLDEFRIKFKDCLGGDFFNSLLHYEFEIEKKIEFRTFKEGDLTRKLPFAPTSEDFTEFGKKLKLFFCFPDDKLLTDMVNQEVGTELRVLNDKIIYSRYLSELYVWLQSKIGTFFTKETTEAFFRDIGRDLLCWKISGVSEDYLNSVSQDFHFEQFTTLTEFLGNDNFNPLKLIFDSFLIGQLKIVGTFKILKAQENFNKFTDTFGHIFLNLKGASKTGVLSCLEDNTKWNLIVVECNEELKMHQKFIDNLIQKAVDRKIVFYTIQKFADNDFIEGSRSISTKLEDFTDFSQKNLFEKDIIDLQGRNEKISFNKLLGNSIAISNEFMDSATLIKMLNNDVIKIGMDLPNKDSFYIERFFYLPTIDKNHFDKMDMFEDILTYSEAEFSLWIQKDAKKPVHLILQKGGQFVWQKSHGSISNLIQFRLNVDKNDTKVTEVDFVNNIQNNDVIIISDTAGMGKSTICTSLSKILLKERNDLWVIRVNLNEHSGTLYQEQKSRTFSCSNTENATIFLLKLLDSNEKTKFQNEFENNLFKIIIKNRVDGIIILFDAFDEINPNYGEIVTDLLEAMKSIGMKLIVTTRPNFKRDLEHKLNVLTINLIPFSAEDQITFLCKFWNEKCNLSNISQNRLEDYAKELVNKVSSSLEDKEKSFTGVPLQTKMMADIFLETTHGEEWDGVKDFIAKSNEKPTLPMKLNIVFLYDKFIEKKCWLHLAKQCLDPKLPASKETFDACFSEFEKNHTNLALFRLFDEDELKVLLPEENTEKLTTLMGKIVNNNVGIIGYINNGKPSFVHLTFAEYFAAKFFIELLKKLKKEEKEKKKENKIKKDQIRFVFDQILGTTQISRKIYVNLTLQAFFNDLLKNKSIPHQTLENALKKGFVTKKSIYRKEDIENAVISAVKQKNNNIFFLFEKCFKSEFCRTEKILFLAIQSGNLELIQWLIKPVSEIGGGIDVNSKNQFGENIIDEAVRFGNFELVMWLFRPVSKGGGGMNIWTIKDKTIYLIIKFVNVETLKQCLMQGNGVQDMDLNVKNNSAGYFLKVAAQSDKLEWVKWLCKPVSDGGVGVDVKKYGEAALNVAVEVGNSNIVAFLKPICDKLGN